MRWFKAFKGIKATCLRVKTQVFKLKLSIFVLQVALKHSQSQSHWIKATCLWVKTQGLELKLSMFVLQVALKHSQSQRHWIKAACLSGVVQLAARHSRRLTDIQHASCCQRHASKQDWDLRLNKKSYHHIKELKQ